MILQHDYWGMTQTNPTPTSEQMLEAAKPEYMFRWCGEYKCLKSCYYPHGEKSPNPWCLDPDCAVGPA